VQAVAQTRTYSGWIGAARVASRLNYSDLSGHWAREAILRVASLGVLTGEGGRFRPQAALSREEALTALLSLSGSGTRGTGLLDRAEGAGIVTREERAGLEGNLAAAVQRQEFGAWLARAAGLAEAAGPGNLRLAGFSDAARVRPEYRGGLEFLLERGWLAGRGRTLAPQASITRAEAASLLYRALPEVLPARGWEVLQGVVAAVDEVRTAQGLRLTVQVAAAGGDSVELVAGPGAGTAAGPDWPVVAGGRVGTASALSAGQVVRVWITPPTVRMAEVLSGQSQRSSGTLAAVDAGRGEITVLINGRSTVLSLHPGARISVGGSAARLSDLLPGQEVELSLRGGMVEELAAELPVPELAAYAETPGRVVTGYLAGWDGSRLRVVLAGGQEQSYYLSPAAAVVSGSRAVAPSELRVGDLLRITISDTPASTATRVEVAAGAAREELWYGRLAGVLVQDRVVLVSQPRRLYFGRWLSQGGQRAFALSPEARVYRGATAAELEDLRNLMGSQVFLSVGQPFGREEAAWLALREGEPWIYQDRLADWDAGRRVLTLSGGTRLTLPEEARVLAAGRAVDPAGLETDRPLVAVAADAGAVFVEQTEYYPSSWSFYRGEVEEVEERCLVLDSWSRFDGDYWSDTRYRDKELTLTGDTVAVDATGAPPRVLDLYSFLQARHTGAFDGRQVYVVADGSDRVRAVVLRDEERGPEVASLATVGGSGEFADVLSWSPEYRAWRELGASLALDTSKALVFRNGYWVGPAALAEGDPVYLLHDYEEALIVFLQ
jgi:hypothetical protein